METALWLEINCTMSQLQAPGSFSFYSCRLEPVQCPSQSMAESSTDAGHLAEADIFAF